jgi:hypothetical protein
MVTEHGKSQVPCGSTAEVQRSHELRPHLVICFGKEGAEKLSPVLTCGQYAELGDCPQTIPWPRVSKALQKRRHRSTPTELSQQP